MQHTLVTGFGPFEAVLNNPAERICHYLENSPVAGHRLTARVLETSYGSAANTLEQLLLEAHKSGDPYDLLLCLGVAPRSEHWRVEQYGRNRMEADRPDADGSLPGATRINLAGPEVLEVTVPTGRILDGLRSAGIPAALSPDAGEYLCNYVLYRALACIRAGGLGVRAGFLHIPADEDTFRETVAERTIFPFERHIEAIEAVLRALA